MSTINAKLINEAVLKGKIALPDRFIGPKGDPGDSGVYVGVEEPEDQSIVVWVNPNGDIYMGTAINIEYDNNATLIDATNVQDAIDALYALVEGGGGGGGSITTIVENLKTIVEGLDAKLQEMEGSVTNLESQVTNVNNTVTTIETTVNNLSGDVSSLKDTVDGIDSKVKGYDSTIQNLETKVNNLDGTVGTLDGKVTNMDTTVNNLSKKIEGLDDIYAKKEEIPPLQQSITNLENTRIAAKLVDIETTPTVNNTINWYYV